MDAILNRNSHFIVRVNDANTISGEVAYAWRDGNSMSFKAKPNATETGDVRTGTASLQATGGLYEDLRDQGFTTTSDFVEGNDISITVGSNGRVTIAYDGTVADGAITTAKLADDAVTNAKVADDAIGADQLATGAVGTDALAADAVTAAKVATNAVTADSISAGAVGTSELADDAVTDAKVAASAIGSTQLADSAVVTAKVADSAVTLAKMTAGTAATSGQVLTVSTGGAVVAADAASGSSGTNQAYKYQASSPNPTSTASIYPRASSGGTDAQGEVPITPSATDAVIELKLVFNGTISDSSAFRYQVTLQRSINGGSWTEVDNGGGSFSYDTPAAFGQQRIHTTLDAPNTTSEVKYRWQIRKSAGPSNANMTVTECGAIATELGSVTNNGGGGGGTPADGSITTAKLADGAVSTVKISGLTATSSGFLQADGDGTVSVGTPSGGSDFDPSLGTTDLADSDDFVVKVGDDFELRTKRFMEADFLPFHLNEKLFSGYRYSSNALTAKGQVRIYTSGSSKRVQIAALDADFKSSRSCSRRGRSSVSTSSRTATKSSSRTPCRWPPTPSTWSREASPSRPRSAPSAMTRVFPCRPTASTFPGRHWRRRSALAQTATRCSPSAARRCMTRCPTSLRSRWPTQAPAPPRS